jgi:hypothetical protein
MVYCPRGAGVKTEDDEGVCVVREKFDGQNCVHCILRTDKFERQERKALKTKQTHMATGILRSFCRPWTLVLEGRLPLDGEALTCCHQLRSRERKYGMPQK